MKTQKKLKAFSLFEILVALAIIGVITLVYISSSSGMIDIARSTEAKNELTKLYTLEETYYYMNAKYSSSMDEIKYEKGIAGSESGQAKYMVEIIEASTHTFKARATAISDFDGDGKISTWEIDQNKKLTEITPD